jgi:hypothetical protein
VALSPHAVAMAASSSGDAVVLVSSSSDLQPMIVDNDDEPLDTMALAARHAGMIFLDELSENSSLADSTLHVMIVCVGV